LISRKPQIGENVGIDATLMNAEALLQMKKILKLSGLELKALKENLIDFVWTEEGGRPPFKVFNKIISRISVFI